MANDISITMSADDRGVIKALRDQNNQIIRNQDALRKMGRQSARTADETKAGFDRVITTMGVMQAGTKLVGAGYDLVRTAITGVIRENERLSKSIDDVAKKRQQEELKLRIQSGLTPAGLRDQLPKIQNALQRTPSTDVSGALAISTQLVSSGFRPEDVKSGAAIQTVLDLKAATNLFGEEVGDPKEAVKALSQFLKAQGNKSPSAKDIRGTGARLTQLFEGSDIQFADLTDLAANAAVLKGKGLDETTQLAAFSVLRDVKASPEASTGLRQVVSRLSTAGGSSDKVGALKQLGLTAGDVDLVGETLPTALGRLNKGLSGIGQSEQNIVLNKLFGEKGEAAASILLGGLGTIEERISLQQDTKSFDRNLRTFQTSRFAQNSRIKSREEFALRKRDEEAGSFTFEELRALSNTARAEGRVSPLGKFIGDTGFKAAEAAGLTPRELGFQNPNVIPPEVREGGGDNLADSLQTLLDEIRLNQREQRLGVNPLKVEVVNGPEQNRGKRPRQPKAAENNRN